MRRPLLTTTMAITVVSLLATPAAAATTARGTAATTSVPLHVEAADVPVDVGRLSLLASTDADRVELAPWSQVGLTLLDVAGTTFGDVSVRSDGETSSDGLSLSRATDVGTVGATVGSVLAVADDVARTAESTLTTLTTRATVLQALGLDVTVSDALASVDDSAAEATHTLMLAGVDIDLAHVLGSVLGQLPLRDLVALADQLGVTVPANIDAASDVVAATEDLVVAVADAATAAVGVEDAAEALLLADDGTLAALQALETTLATLDVTELATFLTDPLLADCAGLTTIEDVGDCIADQIDQHLATLTDAVSALEAAVDAYATAVQAAVDAAAVLDGGSASLGAVVDEIEQLVADLLAVRLVAIDDIEVDQHVRAVGGQLDASFATHTCRTTSVTALGMDPVEVADCDGGSALDPVVTAFNDTLGTVLDTVGGVGAGDGVALTLFGVQDDVVREDDDDFVRATSVLEVLSLTVPDITVTACEVLDGLACALGIDLDDTLATTLDEVDGVLDTAQTTASTALASVADLLTAVGSTADVADQAGAQGVVDDAVALLETAIATLDLGDLGTADGVTVPGARVVVDPELEAEHQVVTAADPAEPTAPAPDPAPAPGPEDPTLPNTGGGAALLAVLALGASAMLWRRRETA